MTYDLAFALPRAVPSVLAVGAFLKNTVCVTKGDRAFLSPAVGNLDSREAITRFEESVAQLLEMLDVVPALVAHDLHPDFHSTRWAQGSGLPTLAVQHHHAHIAAIAAEHQVDGPVLGLSLDGFGLGPGNQSWGGELMLVTGADYMRLGHLAEMPQPGGDIAAREPWRMAAAALHRMGRGAEIAERFVDQKASGLLAQVLDKGINCPPTSSCGRLFDAACGLLGLHPVASFEGQAPMALEKLVTRPQMMAGGCIIRDGVLDLLPLLERLIGLDPAEGADLFHGTLISAFAEWVDRAAEPYDVRTVALGGGCFFNAVLTTGLVAELQNRGFRPIIARQASPGDPGLSLGQAWIAGLVAERGE